MQSDPLQQLRDVHAPLDPSWWPPASGWWVLFLFTLCLIVWAAWRLLQTWRHRAPLRAARKLHAQYCIELERGALTPSSYIHASNELLKRVLVRGYNKYQFAPLSGITWLQALDRLSDTQLFTEGPGQALGDARFSPHQPEDPVRLQELSKAIDQVLANTGAIT